MSGISLVNVALLSTKNESIKQKQKKNTKKIQKNKKYKKNTKKKERGKVFNMYMTSSSLRFGPIQAIELQTIAACSFNGLYKETKNGKTSINASLFYESNVWKKKQTKR